ncbi:MAG: pyruvate kinase [Lachnospirales bacterium]
MKKTKIICTLGPATNDVETIKKLIDAGLNAARMNFSHGDYEEHKGRFDKLKQAREEMGEYVPIVLDTKGPEIRLRKFKNGPVNLVKGSTFTLTTEDVEGDETIVSVSYNKITEDLNVGSTVLLDDGLVELVVKKINGNKVICEVMNNGELSNNKGVNLPDVYINLPSLTEKDKSDIIFGIKNGIDYVAASFVRSANDVKEIRKVLNENGGSHIDIISKIESRSGVNNLDEILEVTEGIMVARGDLGVEIPPEEVPFIQKTMIQKANKAGKLVVTATQMLETMTNNPRPTRAEASDVANAIYDGTDCIMLSGETAKGKYPVEAVEMMSRIAVATEKSLNYNKNLLGHKDNIRNTIVDNISFSACLMANDLDAACIIPITSTGYTARMVSRFKPSCPIVVCTDKENIARKLNLVWGCKPVLVETFDDAAEVTFSIAATVAKEKLIAKKGDSAVLVTGFPMGKQGTTNMITIDVIS